MTEALQEMSDAQLIAAVRDGDGTAFGRLYERHLVSAKRAAACLAGTTSEREDLVAEAFTRVLRVLREGRGPDEEFRPYLLVTLRNTAIHATTRRRPVSLFAEVPDVVPASAADPVIDRWHATVAAEAFASLPERWRVVLWHTEVEMESPATVAAMLGMRPNSVAALAYRAREGLRQAYLRMYLSEPARRECVPTVNKLAGWVRHHVPAPLTSKIDRHLSGCAECRARAEALTKVNAELRGVLAPVVLGAPLAAAYLQTPAAVVGAATAVSGAASVLTGTVATSVAAATGAGTMTGALGLKAVALNAASAVVVAAAAVASTSAPPPWPAGVPAAAEVPAGVPSPVLRLAAATTGPPAERSPDRRASAWPRGASATGNPGAGVATGLSGDSPATDDPQAASKAASTAATNSATNSATKAAAGPAKAEATAKATAARQAAKGRAARAQAAADRPAAKAQAAAVGPAARAEVTAVEPAAKEARKAQAEQDTTAAKAVEKSGTSRATG